MRGTQARSHGSVKDRPVLQVAGLLHARPLHALLLVAPRDHALLSHHAQHP